MDWQDGYFKLFMGHVSEHMVFVGAVKSALAEYGIDGFVAHEDINPSKEWQDEIVDALSSCQAIAVFLHKGFHESAWTDQELGYCLARDVKVIPLRFDLIPYGFIGKFQAATCSQLNPEQVAKTIFDVLIKEARSEVEEAMVYAFANSTSYKQASDRSKRLEKVVKRWSVQMLDEMEKAIGENSQCTGAYNVPERIKRIVEKERPYASPF